jgi:hypothetical protein
MPKYLPYSCVITSAATLLGAEERVLRAVDPEVFLDAVVVLGVRVFPPRVEFLERNLRSGASP